MTHKVDKKIMVRTSFRGTHNWPEASQFAGDEVSFLEARHRHTFHVKAELAVSDSDREVEFFVFQEQIDKAIVHCYGQGRDQLVYNLNRRSCETISEEIINALRSLHGYKGTLSVEVWEDNEVGASVTSHVED